MKIIMHFITVVIFLLLLFVFPKNSFATRYDLIAPSEILQRGQTVTFIINIDTQEKSLTSGQIGLTYDTQVLEFVNATPGNTFGAVTTTAVEQGKFLVTGTDSTPFNGQGLFANINFKIIATAAGSTELCALWAPLVTPTLQPTTIQPTSPLPTSLPRTGGAESSKYLGVFGILFTSLAVAAFAFINKSRFHS